jgi:NADH-quinone oxidoreductase subunit G
VNKFWMCDEGRFTYKRLSQPRLGTPTVAGAPVEWDRALDEAARLIKFALDRNPGGVGVVFNAQSTNEDLYVLGRLAFEQLKLERAYLAGLDEGWHDDILVSADKNPNTAGARAVGAGRLKSLLDLARDVKAKSITTLIVVGDQGVLGPNGLAALPLESLEGLVVLASHSGPLTEVAQVVLPISAWAECDGTFTNKLGMVQRIRAALQPPGDALAGWDVLSHLGTKLGATWEWASAKQVFTEAREKLGFMRGADWGRPFLPVQLRFANTRG